MDNRLFILLLLISCSFAQLDIILYHIDTCPHCIETKSLFEELSLEYELNIIQKEVYYDNANREELFSIYEEFGHPYTGIQVPTILVNDQALVIGSMSKDNWKSLFDDCLDGCTEGIYTSDGFTLKGSNSAQELTLTILIGAALLDSLNPCTIAVMVMLLGVILFTKGKERALFAGVAFAITIFVMYLIIGLGFLHAITSTGLTNIFFMVVTAVALILSIMEINAYFRYKPGFGAVEMPMFLRPHTKSAIKKATSLSGIVISAMLCSLFLLPCSSGPYLLVLGTLAKAFTTEAIFYLILYNFVFILPMLVVVFAIYKGMTTVEDMRELKNKYIKEIHLVSGIILFMLFLIMFNQLFHFV